jgi:hypothetical protein
MQCILSGGGNMGSIAVFLSNHFTGYMLFVVLMSSYVLYFMDKKQLKDAGLKGEASFAKIAGIVYAVLGVVLYFIGAMAPL